MTYFCYQPKSIFLFGLKWSNLTTLEKRQGSKKSKKQTHMQNKLTSQIAHCYNGAKVITQTNDIGILVGVFDTHNSINIELPNKAVSIGWKASRCQLLLTPLAKISDEDAREIARIEERVTAECDMKPSEIIDFLRSSTRPDGTPKPVYDCGYGSIKSLINAGIAIDETTLNSKS